MHKGIIIYISILLGLALTIGGSYFIINNLIEPNGLMFEGIIAAGLGITLLMIVIVASTIGKTLLMFGDILEQTTKLNHELSKKTQSTSNLPNFFQNMMPGNSMTITNMDTGETKKTPLGDMGKMNDMIMNAMEAAGRKTVDDLNSLDDNELEKLLAKSIKKDDFEKAAEISYILRERRNLDSDEDENTSE
jgi:hypothetical protein